MSLSQVVYYCNIIYPLSLLESNEISLSSNGDTAQYSALASTARNC